MNEVEVAVDGSAAVVNQLQLSAQILAKESLRYSPGGVPILALELQHVSSQREAGTERQIEVVMAAKAAGPMAELLDRAQLTSSYRFTGFIAKKSRNSKHIVFHVTAFE